MAETDLEQNLGASQNTLDLMPLVYDELKKLARRRLNFEKNGISINSTDLVHEAYIRIANQGKAGWSHRGQFFLAASEAMRRILIDRARRRKRLKRGGNRLRVELDDVVLIAAENHELGLDLLDLEDALKTLESEHPDAAEIIKLKFFTGLTLKQAAEASGIPLRTAHRNWRFGRARLFQLINS